MVLTIDAGGTTIKYAVLDQNGAVISSGSAPTKKGDAFLPQLRGIIEEMRGKSFSETTGGGSFSFDQVAIAVPGPSKEKTILKSVALELENVSLEGLTDLPFIMTNDSTAAIFGGWRAAGSPKTPFVGFTLGTGVGGGMLINGTMVTGVTSSAGEFGHMSIDADGPACGCGNRGCLERYVGWKDLVSQAQALGLMVRDGKDLFNSVDPRAQELWDWVGHKIGFAVSNIIWAVNPSHVLLTGGVARAFSRFEKTLREEISRRVIPALRDGVQIYANLDEHLAHQGLLALTLSVLK
ncbi:MAG: glucokinase [Candidatus Magasanikbacteria bacterium]|nr:glucokinase [Candidatus Magasanikbacteria bacterium]